MDPLPEANNTKNKLLQQTVQMSAHAQFWILQLKIKMSSFKSNENIQEKLL